VLLQGGGFNDCDGLLELILLVQDGEYNDCDGLLDFFL